MDKFLKLKEVVEMAGISKTEIYRRIEKGTFPQLYSMGARCARWKQSEVQAWIHSQTKKAG